MDKKNSKKCQKKNKKNTTTSNADQMKAMDSELSNEAAGEATRDTSMSKEVVDKNKAKVDGKTISEEVADKKKAKEEDMEGKSKSQLRAERRAVQEAQRAAKAKLKENKEEKTPVAIIKKEIPKETKVLKPTVEKITGKKPSKDMHNMKLFIHLQQTFEDENMFKGNNPEIHPCIVKLGVQYKCKVIVGSNARVISLIDALKKVVKDIPMNENYFKNVETKLSSSREFLEKCRPLSVTQNNALKYLKSSILQISRAAPNHETSGKILEKMDDYVKEQVDMAGRAICLKVLEKILAEDTILTYGYSSLIERILKESYASGISFRVIIVDGRPFEEGKKLLDRLSASNIPCTFVALTAASIILKRATKVLLGAHALLTNGYVMSRAGSSQIALLARSCNIPVLVCCETHKFSERVQTDVFVHNELAETDKITKGLKEMGVKDDFLTPLSFMYDVTPPDLITAVVTELAILPCTSVPVVLRVKPTPGVVI